MNPAGGELRIPSLGNSSDVNPGELEHLTQLYDGRDISFEQGPENLVVNMPPVNAKSLPVVLKATFLK